MAKVKSNESAKPSTLPVGFLMLLGSVLGCVFTFVISDQFQMSTKARNIRGNQTSIRSLRTLQHEVVTTKADRLAKEVRILCWVLTQPKSHYKKAVHVKNTWGKRCDKLIFMSTKNDEKLGAVGLNTSEGYYNLWGKTKAAFRYVYDHYLNEYDWFLKADDDTYMILENMRYMLSSYDPKYPIYFGSKFRRFYKKGFLGGGSGYVLSREATRKLVEEAIPNKNKCKAGVRGLEDVELAACLLKVGVLIGDSRDSLGRGRFFPLGPDIHIMGQTPGWYKKYAFYKPHLGLHGCSETAIAFHRVTPELMYWYDFLLYYVRAYGVKYEQPFPPHLPPDRKCIPQENAWCVHSRVVCTGNFPNIVLAVGRVYYHRRSGPLIFLLLSNIYREGEKPQHESTPITVIVKRLRFILKLSIQIMYGYLNNEMLIYYMISRYHMDTGTE